MGFRDIMVFLDAGPASAGRLQLASRIARQHGADLSAAFLHDGAAVNHAAIAPHLALGAQLRSVELGVQRRDATQDDMEADFRQCLRAYGGDGEWHAVQRGDRAHLIELARTVDLLVLGQINPHLRPAPWWRTNEIVVGCGRPVLLVPYVGRYAEVGRRVLIAWDGSREAAHALHDAVPMMDGTSEVTVVTVRNHGGLYPHDRAGTERVIRYLARHDIAARAEHPERGSNAVSDVLLSAAMDCSADLIVAGAYHHSPLREALVGGVSRELLQAMTVPVLMAH